MNWQEFNAICARKMPEYYKLSVVNVGRGYRALVVYVLNGKEQDGEMGYTCPTRADAFAEGMFAIRAATGIEAETGGWRE